MEKKDGKTYIDWSDVNEFVLNACAHFRDKNPTGVYGVPRGGLILATLLSYKLNVPLLMAPITDCIVVDDIADSGRTLCHFTENDTQFNKYYISTMFYMKRSIVKPDYYQFLKTDEWLVFPWEE